MPRPTALTDPVKLGESPLWDDDRSRLMWVDIGSNAVLEFDPATGENRSERFDVPVGAVARRAGGGFVFAVGLGFATCAWPDTELTWLATVERGQRMNDAAVDPAGRFLAGTLVTDGGGGAGLYQLDRGEVRLLLADVSISNGLDWSLDGHTMYYIDTPLERVDAFDYDVATGAISARRTLVDLHDVPGRPDGLTVDADGGIWVAMSRGGAAVRRFTPDGHLDRVIKMPAPYVSSVAFGGDHLGDLYVTTLREPLSPSDLERWPLAGSLFRILDIGALAVNHTRYVSRVSSMRHVRPSPAESMAICQACSGTSPMASPSRPPRSHSPSRSTNILVDG